MLKKPVETKKGMRVIMVRRSGREKMRNGVVLKERFPKEPYFFVIRGRKFPVSGSTLFTASFAAEKGDSGALVLSEDGRFPVGMVIASSRDDPSVTFCHRLIEILPSIGVQGFFCPLGLPKNSSGFLREIVASLVPDGLFLQDIGIISKSEPEVLDELRIKKGGENYDGKIYTERKSRNQRDDQLRLGDKAFLAGKLALDKEGKIVGIAVATSKTHTLIQSIGRIERALDLKLLKREAR